MKHSLLACSLAVAAAVAAIVLLDSSDGDGARPEPSPAQIDASDEAASPRRVAAVAAGEDPEQTARRPVESTSAAAVDPAERPSPTRPLRVLVVDAAGERQEGIAVAVALRRPDRWQRLAT